MPEDVRWKQRFSNLRRAFDLLQEAATAESLSSLEQEGLIQRFEYTFELSWKTMKDYLESQGASVPLPLDVLKQAFASGLISDGDTWIDMLEKRSLLSHTYNESAFNEAARSVREAYYPCMKQLIQTLQNKE
jgi:nucleotidyltransferase substrate binding protein (TIGR01987 family)